MGFFLFRGGEGRQVGFFLLDGALADRWVSFFWTG